MASDSSQEYKLARILHKVESLENQQTSLTPEQLTSALEFACVVIQKQRCNLAREFSDGLKMAEILRHYLSANQRRHVEMHMFVRGSSRSKKRSNWDLQNRKVMANLFDYEFPDTLIDGCISA